MPSNGGKLRQFMWPLLRRVGVGSRYDTTVLQYDVLPTEERRSSAWIRMRVDTLLVVDWSHRQGNRSDLHHLPTQFALSMLRERLAFPGVHNFTDFNGTSGAFQLSTCHAASNNVPHRRLLACAAVPLEHHVAAAARPVEIRTAG